MGIGWVAVIVRLSVRQLKRGEPKDLGPTCRRNSRALEFNDIPIWIFEVQRRAVSFGTEVVGDRAERLDSAPVQRGNEGLRIKGFDAQANMVDISAFAAWPRATQGAQATRQGNQVNHRPAGAQMDKTQIIAPLDHVASDHALVERNAAFQAGNSQHKVIDVLQCEGQHGANHFL